MAATAYTPISNRGGDQAARIEYILACFQQARLRRYNFEAQWQESSLIYLPEWANTFTYGYRQYPGTKKSQYQIEGYPSIAAHRFMAIANSLMTPWTMQWGQIEHPDEYVMKQRGVANYYAQVSRKIHTLRYNRKSGFLGNQLINWLCLGVFGNQNMFIEELYSPMNEKGLSYTYCPVGQIYYLTNYQGIVDAFFRAWQWNARQIYQRWPDTFPESLRPALDKKSQNQYWIVQAVYPNDEYDPEAYLHPMKGKRYTSTYISVDGHCVLEDGGYRSFPLAAGRYIVAPDEEYGRGPGQIVLPAGKSMQAMKGAYLKQTHRKGDPILLTPDGGLVDPSEFIPGDVVEGGMDGQGHMLVGVLPTGDVAEIKDAMDREQAMIDDGFLTALFQLAIKTEDQPQMNVRQMMEYMEQRAMLIGPTVGRQLTEYLAGMIEREVDLAASMRLLPPTPPVLKEAGTDFVENFDNPLTRMISSSDAAAFMQSVEMAAQVAQASQDMSIWDSFAFDRAIPEMTQRRGTPRSWTATPQEVKAKQQGRAQQAEREASAKEMPAKAAIIKAQAIAAKAQAGQNIGGTLSGTAPGGMPVIPGNQGTPGLPGIGGAPGTVGQPG
jgi:head-to-tail connecting protein